MTGRPTRVVVVGADAAVWLAALTLQTALRASGVSVEAIVLPSRSGGAHLVEARPAAEALHNLLAIGEDRLLRATKGAFTLGRRLVDGVGRRPDAFVGYGSSGAFIGREAFFPHWLMAKRNGLAARLEDFNLVASAALRGRMLIPDSETAAVGHADYGYNFPAAAYARSLASLARQDAIVSHQTKSIAMQRDSAGQVTSVVLDGDRAVQGDLFIDVSDDAVLVSDLVREPADDWSHLFPADRVVRAITAPTPQPPAHGQVVAREWGWLALHPTPAATFALAAFRQDGIESPAGSFPDLDNLLAGAAPAEVIKSFGRATPWSFNCVAIGPAAFKLDPVFGLDHHVLQLGLIHLVNRFPASGDASSERTDYNQTLHLLVENLRDFQVAHYRSQNYQGPFWDRARIAPCPPRLAHRLATFTARGELGPLEHETISIDEWQSLLIGHGVSPLSYSPVADLLPREVVESEFQRILDFVARKVSSFPTNEAYLSGFGGRPS